MRTSKGTAQGLATASITLTNVTIAAGSRLVVVVSVIAIGTPTVTVTFGSTSLVQDATSGSATGQTSLIFSGAVSGTQTITVTSSLTAAGLTLQAIQVAGLPIGTLDVTAQNAGTNSAPDTGSATTATACEYVQGGFLLTGVGASPFTWQNSFTNGGQDVSETVGGRADVATEGYRISTQKQLVDAAIGGVTPLVWTGVMAAYK